jgi:hypothetical protein
MPTRYKARNYAARFLTLPESSSALRRVEGFDRLFLHVAKTADLRRTERQAAADRQVLDRDGSQSAAVDLGAQRQQGRVHVSQQGGLQDRNRIRLDELGQCRLRHV